jgi:hypothetical protein
MQESSEKGDVRMTEKLNAEFYEKDKLHHPGRFVQRKFKDPFHFLHNLIDLLGYAPDIIRVYLGKAISPRLREMIMLAVAGANDCNA